MKRLLSVATCLICIMSVCPFIMGFSLPRTSSHQPFPSNLVSLRKSIDIIDDEIYDLLRKRFQLCHEVKKYKSIYAIEDRSRELSIITRLQWKQELDSHFVASLWNTIFEESKRIQGEL